MNRLEEELKEKMNTYLNTIEESINTIATSGMYVQGYIEGLISNGQVDIDEYQKTFEKVAKELEKSKKKELGEEGFKELENNTKIAIEILSGRTNLG